MSVTLSVKNFRSLSGDSELKIGSAINVVVGPNNSGKSNVLRAIALALTPPPRPQILELLDYSDPTNQSVEVVIHVEPEEFLSEHANTPYFNSLEKIIAAYISSHGRLSIPYAITNKGQELTLRADLITPRLLEVAGSLHDPMRMVWSALTGSSGGSIQQHWVPESVPKLFDVIRKFQRRTVHLESTRYVTHGQAVEHASQAPIMSTTFQPHQIVDRLFQMQNPRIGEDEDRTRFNRIREFMRDVTDNPSLELDIPHDKSSVNVRMSGVRFPLSNLGAGIEQLLILATFAVSFGNEMILMDEPELHVHPILQRKLMRFFQSTGFQFVITTHSPAIIDAVPAIITRVQLIGRKTRLSSVDLPSERHEVVSELGYRPSDVVQTNFIIWVEGPSDKIYINHWLGSLADDLVEGIDYTVLFYGGKVLSHFTLGDESRRELVDVITINRRCVLFMDSDRNSGRDELNDTKKRIIQEASDAGIQVLVTSGREIENYVTKASYEAVMADMGLSPSRHGRYADLMTVVVDGKRRRVDKIKFAHRAIQMESIPQDTELVQFLERTIAEIREASLKHL